VIPKNLEKRSRDFRFDGLIDFFLDSQAVATGFFARRQFPIWFGMLFSPFRSLTCRAKNEEGTALFSHSFWWVYSAVTAKQSDGLIIYGHQNEF
jgi:hypothetical protein